MPEELRNKIGQLFMVGFDGLEPNEHITRLILQYRVAGVILFRRNVSSPEQVKKLCLRLQEINAQVNELPLLIALDQEGGMVMRIEQGVTPMPSAMAYQAADSEEDCELLHRISGEEMRHLGINMMLAPVLDVNNNRMNPVIGVRAFGEDPDTVIRYGMAALRGLQSAGVIATAKHFPGHGDTSTDSHCSMPLVTHNEKRLNAIELAPFKKAIKQGVNAIMTAHVAFPAIEPDAHVPATLSKPVLTNLLRDELKFGGVIISDCLEMAAIADGVGVTAGAVQTLQAGTDLVLISHQATRQQAAIEAALQAAQSNVISLDRINQSYQRIQELKKVVAQANKLQPSSTLMHPTSLALAEKVQQAALRIGENFHPLNRQLPVALITVEMRVRSEIDEVATGKYQQARASMLPMLLEAGIAARELVISAHASEQEVAQALIFVKDSKQIVVQTYNAVLMKGQQLLLASIPSKKLWLVAGRLPYDLELTPDAQGRVAGYACRPAALRAVVKKLVESQK